RGVDAEPLLEQGGIDAPEVRGRRHVAVRVQSLLQTRELADHLPGYAGSEEEADSSRAVVGAAVAVLGGATPELRPDVYEHPVRQAARLEVALEREQRVRGRRQSLAQGGRFAGMGRVLAGGRQRDAGEWQAGREHGGKSCEPLGERVVGLRIWHGARDPAR